MNEKDLNVFIEGAVHYFAHTTGDAAEVGTPYLMSNRTSATKDFTGIIGISGHRKGNVYFTAPSILVKVLLMSIGETDTSQDNMSDVVGEVANTISGNARREFGASFMISTPVVVSGHDNNIVLSRSVRSYVIPISWRSYEASLVISLE